MIEYCACSMKGTTKTLNEDRVMVNNQMLTSDNSFGETDADLVAVVCDGVGSTSGGALAAEMIAQSFQYCNPAMSSPLSVTRHLHKINRDIVEYQKSNPHTNDMASTVAGLLIYKNKYLLFNLGDTRIYEYSEGKLKLLSKDHTVSNQMCTLEEMHASGDAITSYIGGYGHACNPYIRTGETTEGGYFLICSDGVYKSLADSKLQEILSQKTTDVEKKRAILRLSLQNGSPDDMSLVLIKRAA